MCPVNNKNEQFEAQTLSNLSNKLKSSKSTNRNEDNEFSNQEMDFLNSKRDEYNLKDMNNSEVRKLFEESMAASQLYDVYVKVAPKPKNEQLKNSKPKRIQRASILDLINQINEIIKILEINKTKKKGNGKLDIKEIRKNTIMMVIEGDNLLKKIYKTKD